jgi:hypothetical protein
VSFPACAAAGSYREDRCEREGPARDGECVTVQQEVTALQTVSVCVGGWGAAVLGLWVAMQNDPNGEVMPELFSVPSWSRVCGLSISITIEPHTWVASGSGSTGVEMDKANTLISLRPKQWQKALFGGQAGSLAWSCQRW